MQFQTAESLLKTHYLQIGLHSVNMRACTLEYLTKSKVPICSPYVNPIQNISITYIRQMLHYLYVTLEWINSVTDQSHVRVSPPHPHLVFLNSLYLLSYQRQACSFQKEEENTAPKALPALHFLFHFIFLGFD